ncbi:MAG: hypothetical protein RRB51_10410 [Thermoproteus sp.]|nr:hypothetical protein [Thermoproteus sp.]
MEPAHVARRRGGRSWGGAVVGPSPQGGRRHSWRQGRACGEVCRHHIWRARSRGCAHGQQEDAECRGGRLEGFMRHAELADAVARQLGEAGGGARAAEVLARYIRLQPT